MTTINTDSPTSDRAGLAWLKDVPATVQAAFEVLATLQLLQEAADNTEAIVAALDASASSGSDSVHLVALLSSTSTRLIDISRRQIETIRKLMPI